MLFPAKYLKKNSVEGFLPTTTQYHNTHLQFIPFYFFIPSGQWLTCHWAHGNAVPAPPIIEIQHSHASNFIKKTLTGP